MSGEEGEPQASSSSHNHDDGRQRFASLQSVHELAAWLSNNNNNNSFIQVDDACWLNGEDEYELDIKINQMKLTIAGPSANAVEATLAAILRLGLKEETASSVTIKAFATQPRRRLPVLQSMESDCTQSKNNSNNTSGNKKETATLLLHFLHIPKSNAWKAITSNVKSLELRQCQIEDWNYIGSPSSILILSLTLPEFTSFGQMSDQIIFATKVQELTLVLHFWLQGDPWIAFCRLLSQARDIKVLTIQYLDLSDDGWELLWQSLPRSIETVRVSFTDDFVDDYRRLTPERRTQRSIIVQTASTQYTRLQFVSFPKFQQDEGIMKEVEAMLSSRRQ